MEEENTSIKDEIKKLNENFNVLLESGRVKGFKLPYKARLGRKKVKNDYTTICYINNNREVTFIKAPISEGTVMIGGTPRLATTDYMLSYKGKPFIIQPSWSIKPFSPADNYDDAVKTNTIAVGYRLLLNTMKSEQISAKKKIGIGFIIGALVIGAIVIYFISKGGLK